MGKGESIIDKKAHRGDSSAPAFSVIAIHEGYQAEIQVNQTFAWLHHCFSADLRLSFNAWTFEKLVSALDTRALSVRIGVEADMIIIASSNIGCLPDHIKRWLDSITCEQHLARALVLALNENASASAVFCEELKQWAARWHAELICCADIHHQPSRQAILRRINERFHETLAASPDPSEIIPTTHIAPVVHQTMSVNQATMSLVQIQEVRALAYHLWLEADRPAGREIDFWLTAEKQVMHGVTELQT